jgi:hypothetical protein
VEKASIICLNGKDLIELMDKNDHLGYMVMRNLSGILSNRLSYTTLVLRREIRKLVKRPVAA